MSFDWDEFQKLSDDEKVAYMRRVKDEAFKASEGKTFPPGSLGLEKRHAMEGSRVIGQMLPDGTVRYYTDDEKRARAEEKPPT